MGTGEPSVPRSNPEKHYPGIGFYRSNDGGATFDLIDHPGGTASVMVNGLTRGHNEICAKTTPNAVVTDREAVSCVDVVYIP